MKRLTRGGAAGLVATIAMSAVMFISRQLGWLPTPPPKEITHRAAENTGADRVTEGHDAFTPAWVAAHAGFGVGCGAGYALIAPILPGRLFARGILYGGLVWAVNYVGVMPALGLYPWPTEDSNSRTATMLAAHAVFGTSLAALESRLNQR